MSQPAAIPKSAYLILGLLSFGEMSGYDIKQLADTSVAIFYASPARSQVYTELRRLAELGYASEREVEQTDRPDKRLYSITESGEDALKTWLEETPTPPDVIKSHLLLKVFFGSRMARPRLTEEIQKYRDDSLKFREMLHQIQKQCVGEPGTLFTYMTTELGIAHSHANEKWADWAIQLLGSSDETFSWSSQKLPAAKA